jgi:hypothetical protein
MEINFLSDMSSTARVFASVSLVLLLAGCSESPPPVVEQKPEEKKPAEPVSGQSAFHKMFVQARSWATDAKPLRLGDLDVDEVKSADGKAAAWEAVFVSESQQKARRYTFSVVNLPARNLREGVVAGLPDSWSPGGQSQPFLVLAFKTDSTAAYEIAMKRGADYARKHPDMPVKFLLEWIKRFPNPTWRVIWGPSVSQSSYSIFVDAMTGEYLQTAR